MKENLKILRKEKGVTQKEIANQLQMSRTTYCNYEQGLAEPDIQTLTKLADYFHTTIDNICGHEVSFLIDKSTYTIEQQKLLEQIKKLSKENCQRVSDYIMGLMVAEEEKQEIIKIFRRDDNE